MVSSQVLWRVCLPCLTAMQRLREFSHLWEKIKLRPGHPWVGSFSVTLFLSKCTCCQETLCATVSTCKGLYSRKSPRKCTELYIVVHIIYCVQCFSLCWSLTRRNSSCEEDQYLNCVTFLILLDWTWRPLNWKLCVFPVPWIYIHPNIVKETFFSSWWVHFFRRW